MNLFILDKDYKLSAQYHSDKHVVKMPLECAQLLSTVLKGGKGLYKPTHKYHPLSIWTGATLGNFLSVGYRGLALCDEYTYRFGREHKCKGIILQALERYSEIPLGVLDKYVQCMPDEFKSDNIVIAYRNYYKSKKQKMKLSYTNRLVPEWLEE